MNRAMVRNLGVALGFGAAAAAENALWGPAGVAWWWLATGAVLVSSAVAAQKLLLAPVAIVFGVNVVQAVISARIPGTTPVFLTYLLALAVLAYRMGAHASSRRQLLAFCAVLSAGSVSVLAASANWAAWGFFTAAQGAICGLLPWLAGRYRAQQRDLAQAGWERAAQLEWEGRILAEQERLRERTRIAQDMHDSLGHELSLIALRAATLELAPGLQKRHRAAAAGIRSAAAAATERLADIIGLLSDDEPRRAELPGHTIGSLADRARASGMVVALAETGDASSRPPAAERALHRIVQEALTNAAKHAPGAPVTINVTSSENHSVVTVTNQHAPASTSVSYGRAGHGLTGLRELARRLGGSLDAGERAGQFEITARLPHGNKMGNDPE